MFVYALPEYLPAHPLHIRQALYRTSHVCSEQKDIFPLLMLLDSYSMFIQPLLIRLSITETYMTALLFHMIRILHAVQIGCPAITSITNVL